jgi:hypothetical protein
MTFNLQKILESKRAYRKQLAARPIAEKLRLLDELRERALAIQGSALRSASNVIREESPHYKKILQNKEGNPEC